MVQGGVRRGGMRTGSKEDETGISPIYHVNSFLEYHAQGSNKCTIGK